MNKAKAFYTVTIVLTLIVMSIGSTYAYFAASVKTQDNEDIARSANYSINLSVMPKYPNPENGPYKLIPMKNELWEKGYNGYDNTPCIDKNGATVCYIYEIVVYEYSSDLEFVSGSLNITTSNISNLSYRLFDDQNNELAIDEDETQNPIYYNSVASGVELPLGDAIYVKGKEQVTLYLMIWLTDTLKPQNETDIGTFSGSVTFYAGKGGQIAGIISSAIEGAYEG